MHYLFYVTKYIHVIHTLASHLRDRQENWGLSGVNVSKPAGYAVCDGNVSNCYYYLRIFLPQKTADLTVFFLIFANWDSFLKVFVPQKWLILQVFRNFCKMGPFSKDFFD